MLVSLIIVFEQRLTEVIGIHTGRVVIVSNIMARFSWPSSSAYSASKMALKCVGDCLRMEMMKFDVKVCTVEPGMFIENTAIEEEKDVSCKVHVILTIMCLKATRRTFYKQVIQTFQKNN